jgi:hypothetical protein
MEEANLTRRSSHRSNRADVIRAMNAGAVLPPSANSGILVMTLIVDRMIV